MIINDWQRQVFLAPLTSFKIGGPARYFFGAQTEDELIEALILAKQEDLPVFILGGGSNILVADNGFQGLVIKVKNLKLKIKNCRIEAQAGVALAVLVNRSVVAGLAGLEWACGIPGTIGAAVRGNAGAFGCQISSLVRHLRVFDNGSIKQYKPEECGFGYRDSVFKHNRETILSVDLELQKGDPQKSQALVKDYLAQRREKQPSEPSAGCVFKNIVLQSFDGSRNVPRRVPTPDIDSRNDQKVLPFNKGELEGVSFMKNKTKTILDMVSEDKIQGGKLPVAYLIEQCGLKGKQIGQAQISSKQANFIVNLGGAKAADVKALIDLTKKAVKDRFGVELEEEIEYVGF